MTMLEPNTALRSLAQDLAEEGPLARAQFFSAKLDAEKPQADLVVASYVLAELPQKKAAEVAVDLWRSAGSALALIEPGTPESRSFTAVRVAMTFRWASN